jgi:hypothetical protein
VGAADRHKLECSDYTVKAVRTELAATAQIAQSDRQLGLDNKVVQGEGVTAGVFRSLLVGGLERLHLAENFLHERGFVIENGGASEIGA